MNASDGDTAEYLARPGWVSVNQMPALYGLTRAKYVMAIIG